VHSRAQGLCGARTIHTVSIAASLRVASRKGPEGVIALKGVGVILHAVFSNRFASRSSYMYMASCESRCTFGFALRFALQGCGK
jgi:hypothetical protein